jgi:peroxiredoxin
MKKIALLSIVGLLALGGGVVVKYYGSPVSLFDKSPLPDFSFPDVMGKQHNISEWHGKILVINFWATWCPPCIKEIPEFMSIQEEYSAKGLQVIGVALDNKESVEAYLAKLSVNYPILIGDMAGIALSQKLGNSMGVVPYTLIVNQQGQIIYQQGGELSKDELVDVITPLVK